MRLTAFPWDGSTSLDLSSPALLPARSNVKRQTAAAAGVPKPPVPGLVETFVHLVKMKEFVCLCLGYIPVMMMRTSLTNWTAVMFASKNLSLATAAACMSTLELGGFAGGLSGGWITDKIGGRRGPVICCFSIMCAPLSLAVQAAVQARSTAFFRVLSARLLFVPAALSHRAARAREDTANDALHCGLPREGGWAVGCGAGGLPTAGASSESRLASRRPDQCYLRRGCGGDISAALEKLGFVTCFDK